MTIISKYVVEYIYVSKRDFVIHVEVFFRPSCNPKVFQTGESNVHPFLTSSSLTLAQQTMHAQKM